MNGRDPDAPLSIGELLSTATSLFERVHEPWLPGAQGPRGLHVREVRLAANVECQRMSVPPSAGRRSTSAR